MDTATLHTFLTLAKVGHMTRTAGELHLTQPAVSAQLHKLEEHVGHKLFDRTPKGMVLTRAGEVFLDYARESLAQLDEGRRALEELAGMKRGSLAIGGGATATTYLLPSLLGQFHARHPDIQLFVREQGSQNIVSGILDATLDLGVVTLPVDAMSIGAQDMRKLIIEPWIADELMLILPKEHKKSGQKTFTWNDLNAQPLVLFEAGSAVRAIIDRNLASAQVRTKIVMELRSIESIKQMVAQGIGAAFVSRFALTDESQGLQCAQGSVHRELAIVTRSDRTMSLAAKTFLEMMRQLRS